MQVNFNKMIDQKLSQFSENECCAKCKSFYVLEGEYFGQAMDWIGCEQCEKWYHIQCVNMNKLQFDKVQKQGGWFCTPECQKAAVPKNKKRSRK